MTIKFREMVTKMLGCIVMLIRWERKDPTLFKGGDQAWRISMINYLALESHIPRVSTLQDKIKISVKALNSFNNCVNYSTTVIHYFSCKTVSKSVIREKRLTWFSWLSILSWSLIRLNLALSSFLNCLSFLSSGLQNVLMLCILEPSFWLVSSSSFLRLPNSRCKSVFCDCSSPRKSGGGSRL